MEGVFLRGWEKVEEWCLSVSEGRLMMEEMDNVGLGWGFLWEVCDEGYGVFKGLEVSDGDGLSWGWGYLGGGKYISWGEKWDELCLVIIV